MKQKHRRSFCKRFELIPVFDSIPVNNVLRGSISKPDYFSHFIINKVVDFFLFGGGGGGGGGRGKFGENYIHSCENKIFKKKWKMSPMSESKKSTL